METPRAQVLAWLSANTGDVVVQSQDGRKFRAGERDGWRTWEPLEADD